jgi:hypothetical protein
MGNNLNLITDITSSASASAGGGVTSITSQDGLTSTPNPITGTGTINQVRVSSMVSSSPTPQKALSGSGTTQFAVPVYGLAYPDSSITVVNRGRVGFTLARSGNTIERIGMNGVQMDDTMTLAFDVNFQCPASSTVIFTWEGAGAFDDDSAFTFTGTPITCTGGSQSISVSASGTVGLTFSTAANDGYTSNPQTDYLQMFGTFTNPSSGFIQMDNLNIQVTQFSD